MYMSLPKLFSRATLFSHLLFTSTSTSTIPLRAIATTTTITSRTTRAIPLTYPTCPANLTYTYSTMSQSQSQPQSQSQSQIESESPSTSSTNPPSDQNPPERLLALPDINGAGAGSTTNIDLSNGGEGSVKLDHLGPLVVNVDGTLSQIANWEHMAEIEKRNTLRVLGKRNKMRLEALKAKRLEEEEAEKERS